MHYNAGRFGFLLYVALKFGGPTLIRSLPTLAALLLCITATVPARAQLGLQTERVYQGPIRLPDFAGRDRKFNDFRSRIRDGMRTGPDFAGHYAIIQIGCGTSCNFAYVGDVSTGQVFDFPYGGESNQQMQVFRSPKSNRALVLWVKAGRCIRDALTWNGVAFASDGARDIGAEQTCDQLL